MAMALVKVRAGDRGCLDAWLDCLFGTNPVGDCKISS